ncbi:MAG: GntR family transcriptional regulator [Solirubrobacterales bacterium]
MNIIISNSSGEPIYEQITSQIKMNILNGELQEMEPLPSIRTLAQQLRISVITTKRAYEELEKEGFIFTMPGKGSFVSSQNKELLREKRLKIVEEKLQEAIIESRFLDLTKEDIINMVELLYEEG